MTDPVVKTRRGPVAKKRRGQAYDPAISPDHPQPLKMLIGLRLRYLRTALCENNQDRRSALSDYLNVDRVTVAAWERGENQPSPENLRQLAAYFDVPLDYLQCREFWDRLNPRQLRRLTLREVWRQPDPVNYEIYPRPRLTLWNS